LPKPNDLKLLEKVKERAEELRKEKAKAVDRIRKGFVKRAIVFMDVVGSTAFKVDHREEPEVWILRVQQFSELMASAAESCNGTVVKYIGDEIMVSFENAYDAQNLIGRVAEIEKNLKTGTGFETRLKVAADYGAVYGLNFDGHEPPDPQGTHREVRDAGGGARERRLRRRVRQAQVGKGRARGLEGHRPDGPLPARTRDR
jgi:class 3 adenylate cyclase